MPPTDLAEALESIIGRATDDGSWSEPKGTEELRLAIQALADVRTLLGWLRDDTELIIRRGLNQEFSVAVVEEGEERDDARLVANCTWDAEAAVSKAAAWVREGKK